jgi:ribosome-associated protein
MRNWRMPGIRITSHIVLDESELEERFVLASGPGGQNVNKVATAVQLRFNVEQSPNLPFDVRLRLRALAGQRLTKDGVLVLDGRRFRSQERNRADVRQRLIALIREAAVKPKVRKPTRPPKSSKLKRLEGKKEHGTLKKLRRRPVSD